MPLNDLMHQTRLALWDQTYTRWVSQEVFSAPWWITVLFLVIIYALWLKLVDRSRLTSILLVGSLAAVASTFVHQVGTSAVFWETKTGLIPMVGPVFPL